MTSPPDDLHSAAPQNPYQAPRGSFDRVATVDYNQNLAWLMFSFKGRINRARYWMLMLPTSVLYFMAIVILDVSLPEESLARMLVIPCVVLFLWISLAAQIKRWHDRDKSGFWILINFIPIIGPIWQFVEVGCLRGTLGDNNYGPDPLASY